MHPPRASGLHARPARQRAPQLQHRPADLIPHAHMALMMMHRCRGAAVRPDMDSVDVVLAHACAAIYHAAGWLVVGGCYSVGAVTVASSACGGACCCCCTSWGAATTAEETSSLLLSSWGDGGACGLHFEGVWFWGFFDVVCLFELLNLIVCF